MTTSTALCSLPAADLHRALDGGTDTLEVYYGPAIGGYALVIGDTLSMVSPVKRCVVNGTADANEWRTHLSALDDGAIITVYEADGVFKLSDDDTEPVVPIKTDAPAPASPAMPIQPLPSSLLPVSSTYPVIHGILTQAELYTHGGAMVRHDPVQRTWDIRTGERTAYRIQLTTGATLLTLYVHSKIGWQAVETDALPALPLHEVYRLFYGRTSS